MLIRRVAEHQINQNLEAQLMGACDEGIKVPQRAKHWIHIAVIADIISEIQHRRAKERRNPNGVHTQVCYMGQAVNDT